MSADKAALLREVFPGLSAVAAAKLLGLAQAVTYPTQTTLCTEGEFEGVFYIIVEGQVSITKRFVGTEGEYLLRTAGPGEFFGEMSLIRHVPRAASVHTVEETTVLEIAQPVFEHVISASPSMALTLFRATIDRLRSNDHMNIVELERKNKQIEEAYNTLAQQERLRSEFLTTLAHELRTPLTSAKGYTQMIQQGMLAGDTLLTALQRVGANVEQVVSLVNDLLFVQEMDLIEPPDFQPMQVDQVVRRVVDAFRDQAAERELALVAEVASDVPAVMGDVEELERAFSALLDNAIKFSPEGGTIRVSVTRSGRYVEVAFSDPGIGIPADFIEAGLFERFRRRDNIDGEVFGGVGLGLPIARRLIEGHNGRIIVESVVGQGSTFTVSLPLTNETPG
jgi:signal transduction histidine kinase